MIWKIMFLPVLIWGSQWKHCMHASLKTSDSNDKYDDWSNVHGNIIVIMLTCKRTVQSR